MSDFTYRFAPKPGIHEAMEKKLKTMEDREAFLIRLAKTLGDNPGTAGEFIRTQSVFKGMRKLPHMDETLGFCQVIFTVVKATVTVYVVRPLS